MEALPLRLALVTTVLVAGCGATYRNPQLMTLSLPDAGGPVMLSEVPTRDPGRDVSVSAGTAAMVVTTPESVNVSVNVYDGSRFVRTETRQRTVYRTSAGFVSSSEGPSPQLVRRLVPADRWVQIRGIAWGANDHSQPYSSHAERTLVVQATAHR